MASSRFRNWSTPEGQGFQSKMKPTKFFNDCPAAATLEMQIGPRPPLGSNRSAFALLAE